MFLFFCIHTGAVRAQSSTKLARSSDSTVWFSHDGQPICLTEIHTIGRVNHLSVPRPHCTNTAQQMMQNKIGFQSDLKKSRTKLESKSHNVPPGLKFWVNYPLITTSSLCISLIFNPLEFVFSHKTRTHIHTHPTASRWENYNSHRLEYICHLARCSETGAYQHDQSAGSSTAQWHFTFKSKAVTPALFAMIVFWTRARGGGGTCGYNNIIWIRMALIANNGRQNTWNKELL